LVCKLYFLLNKDEKTKKQDNETQVNVIMDEESGQWVMGNVVCEGMTIVWCGVPSGGSQGHSSGWS